MVNAFSNYLLLWCILPYVGKDFAHYMVKWMTISLCVSCEQPHLFFVVVGVLGNCIQFAFSLYRRLTIKKCHPVLPSKTGHCARLEAFISERLGPQIYGQPKHKYVVCCIGVKLPVFFKQINEIAACIAHKFKLVEWAKWACLMWLPIVSQPGPQYLSLWIFTWALKAIFICTTML